MNISDAINTIESIAGVTDESTPAGEAWAAILRYIRSTPVAQPVPVSERLPGPEDCDADGRCWLRRKYQPDGPTWRLTRPASISTEALRLYYAEWLPARALLTAGGGGVMTWQPIKTAPRDGQFFIGANADEAIVCNWPKQTQTDYAPGNWSRGRGGWDGSFIHTNCPLTHWQPLPKLPLPGEVKG